jgi:uncharacterized protein
MEIIKRVTPITESNAGTSKRALYAIADPYLTFWHRYIAPLVSSGGVATSDSALLWRKVIAPRLDDYMGEIFEDVCRNFVRQGGILRFKPVRTGRWWDSTSTNEIDIVAIDAGNRVLVAECKWGHVDSRDLKTLRERVTLMARELKEVSSIKYVLFSRHAPTDRALLQELEAKGVSWYGPAALFEN